VQTVAVTNWAQVAVAVFVLFVGTLVYVLDRPGESVLFFSTVNISGLLPSLFGRIGESLPTFSHAFAFSLLTAAWLGEGERIGFSACLTWFGVDTACEVGQHPQISERLVQFIPGWFERLPILKQTDVYFLSGTFDVGDLISIALGAAAAYLVTVCTTSRHIHHG